jgi:hypothetical protein
MTWLPRSVWLSDPDEHESECISCGRKDLVIRRCVFDGKGSAKAGGRIWRDPHVFYATSAKGDIIPLHSSDALGASDAAAGQWAKVMVGVLAGQKPDETRSVWVVGFSTVQNDKYLEAMECVIPFPCLPNQVQESVEKFRQWQKEGSNLTRKIRPRDEKAPSRKHKEIPPMVAAIRPHVENIVSAKAGELIVGTDEAWEQAAAEYRPMMRIVARSLSPGFTVAAVERREQIARVMPDMRPKGKTTKKPGRKKGGDK